MSNYINTIYAIHTNFACSCQCGSHDRASRRVSFGNSVIISLLGKIITKLLDKIGICIHDINICESAEYRKKIPNIKNIAFNKKPILLSKL
jgi:predicted amidohydrolase